MTGIILSFREKVEKIVLRCWYFKNAFHFALMKLLHYSFMSPFSTAFRIIWNCFMYFVCVEESKSMNEKNSQKVIFRILFKYDSDATKWYNYLNHFDKLFWPWIMINRFRIRKSMFAIVILIVYNEKYNHLS